MTESVGANGELVEPKLETPEIYEEWILDVLQSREATGRIARVKATLKELEGILSDDTLDDLGLTQKITEVVDGLRQELVTHTEETVKELNRAIAEYSSRLPEFYIQTDDGESAKRVEGFTLGTGYTIDPIVAGERYDGFIKGVSQIETGRSE